MKLEYFGMAEPGDCRVVFSASAAELEAAVQAEQAAPDAPADEEELLTNAVNRAILEGFSPLFAQLMEEHHLTPVTDPDFELLAVNRAEGFRAGAEFFCLPSLELGRYTGFVQPIQPRPIRKLTLELEINRHHGDEDRAADEAGKLALRQRVAQEIYRTRCAQAETLAERELVYQLGGEVKGTLPKQLVAGNYFAEQREFNLRLQANNVNFDQYLKVRNQTVEQFRAGPFGAAAGGRKGTALAHRGRGGRGAGGLEGRTHLPLQRPAETAAGHRQPAGCRLCPCPLHPDPAPRGAGDHRGRRVIAPPLHRVPTNRQTKMGCSQLANIPFCLRLAQVSTPSNWLL